MSRQEQVKLGSRRSQKGTFFSRCFLKGSRISKVFLSSMNVEAWLLLEAYISTSKFLYLSNIWKIWEKEAPEVRKNEEQISWLKWNVTY